MNDQTVARLKLPISIQSLVKLGDLIREIYGPGLVMSEEPKGWLKIERADEGVKE